MRPHVLLWLLAGAVLLVSFTNEIVNTSSTFALGLDQLRQSGPMGSDMVVFVTSALGRLALLLIALRLLWLADAGAGATPTMKSFTIAGLSWGCRVGRQWLARPSATQGADNKRLDDHATPASEQGRAHRDHPFETPSK